MIPTPKYAIGDKVYVARESTTAETVPCPDCKGTGKWKVVTPMGEEFPMPCATCASGCPQNKRTISKPYTKRLTIGSVRINTEDENQVSYMAVETGVGSGTIWYEKDLFDTEDAAMVLATANAKKRTEELRQIAPKSRDEYMHNPIGSRIRTLESENFRLDEELKVCKREATEEEPTDA